MRYVFPTFCRGTKMRAILVYGGQCRHSSGAGAERAAGPRRAYAEKKRKSSIVLHGPHANLWPLNRSYSSSGTEKVSETNLTLFMYLFFHLRTMWCNFE